MTDPGEQLEALNFDREIPLDELVAAADIRSLEKLLGFILQGGFQVTTREGSHLLGERNEQYSQRQAIIIDLETAGYIESNCEDPACLETAMACLKMQLRFAQKFLMASALHIEAIQEDYAKLCEEHDALLLSEAKYRNLSEHLDEKVQQQVKTIERAQRKLFESDKLASVGHLASGIAHEINNPLGFIKSNLNTARSYVRDFIELGNLISSNAGIEKVKAFWEESDMDFVAGDFISLVEEATDGSERVANIVADLKLFSNIDAEERLTIDLNKYIKSSCNVARTSFREGVTLELGHSGECQVTCRPGYIGQVILALLMNAHDAISGNGTVTIRTFVRDGCFYVEIRDTGAGIPVKVLKNIFDPFFTTKNVGQGKGLGLTACRDIITGHGGEIEVARTDESGTTMRFWIPLSGPAN